MTLPYTSVTKAKNIILIKPEYVTEDYPLFYIDLFNMPQDMRHFSFEII